MDELAFELLSAGERHDSGLAASTPAAPPPSTAASSATTGDPGILKLSRVFELGRDTFQIAVNGMAGGATGLEVGRAGGALPTSELRSPPGPGFPVDAPVDRPAPERYEYIRRPRRNRHR